jgi:dihydropteroate synthase
MTKPRPRVMGVVNITPDSFSDGGRFLGAEAAIIHARQLVAQGAEILDLGGESTRPGAAPVTAAAETARILPVVRALKGSGAVLSIDTMKPEVMRAAAAEGATIWNDVTALSYSPSSLDVAAEIGCGVMLMHMRGEPRTMQDDPVYEDVVGEVCAFLQARAEAAMAAGVKSEAIWVDPGIGFGKTLAHNLELLANLDRVRSLGFRTVLGVSRKRFLRAIDPTAIEATDRLGGSLAGVLIGAEAGMDAVRVHDVRETVQALTVWGAVERVRRKWTPVSPPDAL